MNQVCDFARDFQPAFPYPMTTQVEHVILIKTQAREYYPPEDAPMDLGPTKGCTEAIACLEKHCKLLKGSTSKEVLEVFYQEVGIRLIA